MPVETQPTWRTGREDMQSYDAHTGEPFASIYCDDGKGTFHLGEHLPSVVAYVFGDDCKARARLIAAAPDLLEACLGLMRDIIDDKFSGDFEEDTIAMIKTYAAINKATKPPRGPTP